MTDQPQDLASALAPSPPPSGDYQRTLAENRAAAMLAHQFPRNVDQCQKDMRFSCGQVSVAEEAFFMLKGERNGKPKIHTGSTIKLARELARCWRNIDYGAIEVARTDTHSQILTYAVDLETNARGSVQNIVQHMGRKSATEIYEHNASDASRRLREIIFNILPAWFVAEAEALCRETLEATFKGPVAASALLDRLGALGISQARAEAVAGRVLNAWRPIDMAALAIKAGTIERGDMKADDVFETTVADEIIKELVAHTGKPAAKGHVRQVQEPKPDAPPKPKRDRKAKTTAPAVQGSAAGTAEGGATAGTDISAGRPVEREDTPPNNSGNGSGIAVAEKTAAPTPPPSIASLGAGQGRTAAEPQAEAPPPPVKRGRGRPPKVRPEVAAGATEGNKPAPKPPVANDKAPPKAKARLDLNGSPDADDEPEKFLLYWMERVRVVPVDKDELAAEMDKHVRAKLKGMTSLLARWKSAVDLRLKKIARAAELMAKAH